MIAVNYTQFRNDIDHHIDMATEDYENIVVARKGNKNVVIISEERYNNLLENIHVMGNKANYDWLMDSKRQLGSGRCRERDLIEVLDE